MIRCRHGRIRILVLVVIVLGFAGFGVAQENDPDLYGLGTNYYFVAAEEFNCSDPTGNCSYRDCGDDFWCDPSGYAEIYAPVRLPSGAQVTGYRIIYEDGSAGNFSVRFRRGYYNITNGTAGSAEIRSWTSSGTPGITSSWADVDPDITIQYRLETVIFSFYNNYYLWATLYPSSSIQLRGVIVYWKRQISPAPSSATFPDVSPGYWAFQEIEALAASGITTGFPDGTFRPTEPVTRAQMATFMARALGLHWAP